MNKKNLNDVCVIGSGLSGLVMAAMLTKNNFKVTVFEKMNRVEEEQRHHVTKIIS